MKEQPEREAMIVRGLLDAGQRLEWQPNESATIYVGTDPRCEWRVTADGVAPFHWHLCWYAGRLWMAELGPGHGPHAGRNYQWQMAPIGVVLRIGSAVLLFELGPEEKGAAAAGRFHAAARAGHFEPTLVAGASSPGFAARHGASGGGRGVSGVDLDVTQIVEPDELRALPPFGPRSPAQLRAAPAGSPSAAAARPALEEMFIVPAHLPPPQPKAPSLMGRVTKVVPARMLLALIAAGGMTALTFLRESRADREEAPPAALPARRPPPDAEIAIRAAKPEPGRSDEESAAARDLAAGRLEEAAERYRELQELAPDDPVFRDFSAVIERRVKSRCPQGGCGEGSR